MKEIDNILLFLAQGDYKRAGEELSKIEAHLSALSQDEQEKILRFIDQTLVLLQEEKETIVSKIHELQNLQKFHKY